MESRSIYESIATRTDGDIYIGVVGPVRTGKSTFIKHFMETMVLPGIEDMYWRERAQDELPQSGSGRTIMTAEPKFVPEEAAKIRFDGAAVCNVRLIDCVGYMVDGAVGELEGDRPRMVMTPWFDHEIPLRQAAEVGTRKVIAEHSTIGLVVTTDGSIGDLPREAYCEAEARIVQELIELRKPFGILVNSTDPQGERARSLAERLEVQYGVSCTAVDCTALQSADIERILSAVLYEFPAREFNITLPEWLGGLPEDDPLKTGIYEQILGSCSDIRRMRDARAAVERIAGCESVASAQLQRVDLGEGTVEIAIDVPRELLFALLSERAGIQITNEAELLPLLCEMAEMRREYEHVRGALEQVRQTGYGIVMPRREELRFEQPEIVRQGGRYGVKLRAGAPSIHLIRADIETEISPIVGTEKQSEDLVKYLLAEFEDAPEKIWDSNIFGKSLSELVNEGLNSKLYRMPEEARGKLQETLQRIINEGSGGLICIIL